MHKGCEAGQVIDNRYRIIRRIGSGATSDVFLATHIRAGGLWAIKEVRHDAGVGWEIAWNSLNAEIEILKDLSHPLLPGIVDVAEDGERFYVIMEYFEGRSLEELIRIGGGLDEEKVLKIGIALCDVLSYLHSLDRPVIYRDLKPANILLQTDGQIRLIDFGSAVQFGEAEESVVCDGTPAYAAPEQREGICDERSDIFCLGRTLYHLRSGNVPITQGVSLPDRELNRIIRKCTARKPSMRYATCAEVARELKKAQLICNGSLRRVRRKTGIFAASILMMCACVCSGMLVRNTGRRRVRDTYAYYMEEAANAQSSEDMTLSYRNAMGADPARQDAYIGLLEHVYLADGIYTREEDAAFHEILMTVAPDSRRYETVLEEGPDGPDGLHYHLGMAYFYSYEGNGNRRMAYPHLRAAAESRKLPEQERKEAEAIAVISSYYAEIGQGETETRASDDRAYWEDLTRVLDRGLSTDPRSVTTLMICQEVLTRLHMNAARFREAGISEEQMKLTAERVGDVLRRDASDDEAEALVLRLQMKDTLRLAEQTLQTVFPETKEDTVMQAAVRQSP